MKNHRIVSDITIFAEVLKGKTYEQLAGEIGVTRERVRQRILRARGMLVWYFSRCLPAQRYPLLSVCTPSLLEPHLPYELRNMRKVSGELLRLIEEYLLWKQVNKPTKPTLELLYLQTCAKNINEEARPK